MRDKLLFIPLLVIALAAGSAGTAWGAPSVSVSTERISVDGKTFQVQTVRANLTDPMLQLDPVTAGEGIGYDESFASMVNRTDALAAVNGTFFNAYEKIPGTRYPNGLLIGSGRPVHSGDNPSIILTSGKIPVIRQIFLGVRVTFIRDKLTSTYFPWGINKYYGDDQDDQVVWYTPAMGRYIAYPNGTKIVIRENKVTDITEAPSVPVPDDGYILFVGRSDNNKRNLLPRIAVGDSVDAEPIAKDSVTGEILDPGMWLSAVGAGPKLVTKGTPDIDFARDGFSDPKITTEAYRRSFIGIDGEGLLVMGTVDNATVTEEARIALALGLRDAMNLDGGASSALYADGQMLTSPGRRLSNALVLRRLAEPRVQIEVNGKFVPDFQGFIHNDTTLVPVRPLLEAMGAEFDWDGDSRKLTVRKGGTVLVMKPDVKSVEWNGTARELDTAPSIVDGHLYLPLRFMVETYHGKVRWDGELYRASVDLGG